MRKRTAKILTGIAIALIALSLMYAIAVSVSGAALDRAYAALKEDGRPMALADIMPPEVPDAENAGLLYESAALLLKAQPAAQTNLLMHLFELSGKLNDRSITPDERQELQQLIGQDVVTRAVQLVEQGARRPACHFDCDYEAGVNIRLPQLYNLRMLAQALGAKARLEAQAGDTARAWDTVHTQLRLADAPRDEPLLLSQLVRIAMVRLVCDTIRQVSARALPHEQQLDHIQNSLTAFEDARPLVLGIDGDRLVFGEWAFNLPKMELLRQHAHAGWPQDIWAALKVWYKPTFLAYHTAYLGIMHECAQLMDQPYSSESVTAAAERINKRPQGLAQTLAAAMVQARKQYARLQADIRVTHTGLGLLLNRQSSETFPEDLAVFSPEDVMDPFSGEPLRYRRRPDGFVLYSIGADLKDNEGHSKQGPQDTDWDIAWQNPRPEKDVKRKISPAPEVDEEDVYYE